MSQLNKILTAALITFKEDCIPSGDVFYICVFFTGLLMISIVIIDYYKNKFDDMKKMYGKLKQRLK